MIDKSDESVRFQFGKNWQRFLSSLDNSRITESEQSLKRMLGTEDLGGKSFVDVGSGSGLSSLAARRLGAVVYSFDHDPESVACTRYLKNQFFPGDPNWMAESGSVLDARWLQSRGQFDIVYSWGVLHHTGAMWQALENIDSLVKPSGTLFIAIYNDQGRRSNFWRLVKRLYNVTPPGLRFAWLPPALVLLWGPRTVKDFFQLRPFKTWRSYKKARGMSPWYDLVDWVGGYPFEVAKPQAILDFFGRRGYRVQKLNTCGRGLGCNEFVFIKS